MPKILKVKRVFAWAIYDNLKRVPPKDYPTTGEIKSTITDVLPVLKQHITPYLDRIKKAEDLAEKSASKSVPEEEIKTLVEKLNQEWRDYSKEHGNEVVEISLDEEGFKTLKAQFDREGWGKKWVANIEEFGELLEAFTEASK